ncbi:MAG: WecB/TagA/CpsF family glycosyltransferase [Clostridia bacterium]|nr:WecB/TagA/CpsF family glycosyltransferase [Clostridia bacterium]
MKKVNILGSMIDKLTMKEAVEIAMGFFESEGRKVIYTPNSEIILYASRNEDFMPKLNSADLIIADGIGVVYGAKILRNTLPERVAGFDLLKSIFPLMAANGYSVYLLGSKPGIAQSAGENLKKEYPGLVVAGYHDGYFTDDEEVIDEINLAKPDLLLVCLGFPKQENWIYDNKEKLDVKAMIGAGGCLDVFAGAVERAPEFYCKHGLEWFYRLKKEPWRFKRMTALPVFGLKVLFKGWKYKQTDC